jgi:hypothetical protein
MADNLMGDIPLELQPQMQDISQQQKLSQMLLQQGMQQPQGQMISGRYVAPALTQYLQPLFGAYAGSKGMETAEQKQLELAAALRQKQAEIANQYATAKTPQERLAAAINPYAPKMIQGAAAEMLKPQKLGEGETISQMNFGIGAYEPVAQGAVKISPDVREAMQLLGINKPLDQLNAQELQAINSKRMELNQSKGTNINVNTGQHGFDNALKLRSDFRAEPIYKGFEETKAAKLQIDQAAKMATPAGDLAAATKIMKILDPGSVVRESELGMAMAATGVEDKVRNYAQMVINGTKLTPSQRKDFTDLSNKLYNASAEQFNQKRNEYAGIAERNKLDINAAVGAPAELKESKNIFNISPNSLDAELKRRGLQ